MKGDHVHLEPLHPAHADELWPAADDEAMRRWWPRRWQSLDDVRSQFTTLCDDPTTEPWLVREPDGRAIGSSSLYQLDVDGGSTSLGWTWYIPAVRRSPVNTETKLLLLTRCFDGLGLRRVRFDVDARNTVSQAAVRRIGATYEGTLRQDKVCWDGFVRDTTVWSILADEWPGVRARLQGMLEA